jgi:AcrR family transcriptional regulator
LPFSARNHCPGSNPCINEAIVARRKGVSFKKSDVVAAAIACLDAEGESGMTVAKVAARLGVQPPALYFHISDSENLRRVVAIEGWRRMFDCVIERTAVIAESDTLRELMRTYRRFARHHPALYAVMSSVCLEQSDPEFVPVFQVIQDLLDHVIRPLELTDAQAAHAIRILRAACHGFVELERLGQFQHPEPLDDSFEWGLDLLIDALKQVHR